MLHQNKRSKQSMSDEWWTPLDLFEELVKEYKFKPEIDVCATPGNSLRNLFFTKSDNALKRTWKIGFKKRKCWCNPPAKEQGKFIDKASYEYHLNGVQTMMIVPLNVQSSKAWWNSVQLPKEHGSRIFVRPIRGRRKFMYKGKKDNSSSINGYCVVIFGRKQK